jgi:DNA invertase Pin-like site-specific DNA recombinase
MTPAAVLRIAIYCRCSTQDQQTDNQLTQLRAFAAAQGWTVVAEFIDNATGGNSDRPGFQAMFAAAERKDFDLLLFWSLDRLSREGVLATLNHLERLTACGVSYRSFTEQYLDSCGLFKDAIISIMATLARQERIRISERTKAGLANTRAKGTRLGRPQKMLDTDRFRDLRAQGVSKRACALALNVSESTLLRRAS